MIEAIRVGHDRVKDAYDRRSRVYDRVVAPYEWKFHVEAIEALAPLAGEEILEVAVGPGRATVEIARRVGPSGHVVGVDLSTGMLEVARARAAASGIDNVEFHEADAARLPFPAARFDALYNAYMLDLVPLDEMAGILAEFARVLKPGGRLTLLNMSKRDERESTLRELLYRILPQSTVLYVGGACRPVLMAQGVAQAGFERVTRQFLGGAMGSEIVTGHKPA